MALESQVVSLGFGPGLDTKTDPKAASKPIVLQDCVFTNPHRILKRNGYDVLSMDILTGGTITSPTMVRSYKNELVCAGVSPTTGNRLFSYSSAVSKWIDKGKYNSIEVSKKIIAAPELNWINITNPAEIIGTVNSSGTLLNNIVLYGYDQGSNGPNQTSGISTNVYWAAYDNTTGTRIAGSTISSAYGYVWGFSKVVNLGSSQFAIFYIADTDPLTPTAPKLCFKTIAISSSGVVLGNEVQVTDVLYTPSTFYIYDVVSTPGGCFVAAYAPNGGLNHQIFVASYNTSGAQTHTAGTTTGAQTVTVINVVLDLTSTNAWVYWIQNASNLKYEIYNASTLSAVLAATTAQTGLTDVWQVTAIPTSATTQTNYVSARPDTGNFTIGVFYPAITQQSVDISGTPGSVVSLIKGLEVYGKPFYVSGVGYMPCVSLSQNLATGFIVDLTDGIAVAKFLQTEAEGVISTPGDLINSSFGPPVSIASRLQSFLNPIISFSSTKVGLPSGFVVSLATSVPLINQDKAAAPVVVTESVQMGVCLSSFDFNSIDSYQSVIQRDLLCLNGGIVSDYDGSGVTELGFNVDPDLVALEWDATTGGITNPGLVTYYILYKWTDSNGNLNQSAPSIGVSIFLNARADNSVKVGWAPLNVTQKSNVTVELYRTVLNGIIPYFVGSFDNSVYGWGNTTTSYVDISNDATIVNNKVLYSFGGAILENIAPPPSMILWTNNNRLWCVDSENPETVIQYTKSASQGSGIQFSTGFLEYVIDSRAGKITGASPMDEKTVILKNSGIGYFVGDGANDSGSGSSLSNFQFIPSDVGCSNSKSVVLYPGGIIFRSSKGIYHVTRGAQIQYFGYDVAAYSSQDIVSALIVASKNQIRFLTSNGSSLLYDYVMNQWDVFTNHAGLSSDSYGGLYTYVRSANNAQDNSVIFMENTTSYLDNATAISPAIQIQWVKGQSIQNYERLRQIILLGDYQNGSSSGHGVQISAAYDFGTSFSTPIPYYFGESSSAGVFQYRESLPRQKCDAISLLIQEVTTGASGEFIDFTDLGMELAVKRGLNKLPGNRSV